MTDTIRPEQWRGIVFDLDDTLYAEREYVLSGFRAVAEWAETTIGLPAAASEAELREMFERGIRGDTFNRWLLKHGQDATLVERAVRAYREHVPRIEPLAKVLELLEWMRGNYRLGLVSDGYLDVQKAKFAALKLEPYFNAVVFSDQWGREHWKPSVKPFETVAQLLGLQPSELVYVADNPSKDFIGARKAGFATIRLQREGGEYCRLAAQSNDYAPDLVITCLSQLRSLLAKVNVSSESKER